MLNHGSLYYSISKYERSMVKQTEFYVRVLCQPQLIESLDLKNINRAVKCFR